MIESLCFQIAVIVAIMILSGAAIYKFYSKLTEKKNPLCSLNSNSLNLDKILNEKHELEYHINWAKHSGDTDRFDMLQKELVVLDMQISQLK